jgi:hypothetical protein
MKHSLRFFARALLLPALLMGQCFAPGPLFATVSDVTLTGFPPNTVVTLTNEETKQTVEEKTDDNGTVIIPLIGRDWQAGNHTVTCHVEGKPVTTSVLLRDGPNRIDLSHVFTKSIPKTSVRPSDPMIISMPETSAGDTATSIGKGLVGGVLGGLFGGGRQEGPKLAGKPPYPVQTFTSQDGKTKCDLSGAVDDNNPQIVVRVGDSPGNGAPHLVFLQDNQGNILQPTEVRVFEIWEVWGGWKLTVSWTKSYYQDNQLVKQERGGWSTSWTGLLGRYKSPSEIPGIWQDFGGKPFESIRGVIADFQTPQTFVPQDWNLVVHLTTKGSQPNTIVTQPFVAAMNKNERGVLSFTQRERTIWESALR